MRFDQSNPNLTKASDILNNLTQFELFEIFQKFGEEKYSDVLSKEVIKYRHGNMIKTTGDFKNIIRDAFKLKNCTISETNQAIKRGF